jgi:hypothetical protein
MKLIPYPQAMLLEEAFQASDMKFAFLNPTEEGNFQMIHSWVKCREYFNELLMTNYHPEFKYQPTYGFTYNQKEYPLDLSATRIALKFPTAQQKQTFLDNIQWIHTIEAANEVDKTITIDVNEQELIVIASKLWIQQCLLTNIYTLLLKLATLNAKLGYNHLKQIKIKDCTPSEVIYITTLTHKTFNNILENCTYIAECPSKYVDGSDTLRSPGDVHASTGLMHINYTISKKTSTQLSTLVDHIKTLFTTNPKLNLLEA